MKDYLLYCDFAIVLVEWTLRLYKDDYTRLGLDDMALAIESSIIELCLKLCHLGGLKEKAVL